MKSKYFSMHFYWLLLFITGSYQTWAMSQFWGQCQCQWFFRVNVNTQCQCWLMIVDHHQCQWQCQCLDFPQCQCIEICQWLLTFYNRVNSCYLNVNVNVNSCLQSLTSLNVNGNVNDSKIVNSMSIVNVNGTPKYIAHVWFEPSTTFVHFIWLFH